MWAGPRSPNPQESVQGGPHCQPLQPSLPPSNSAFRKGTGSSQKDGWGRRMGVPDWV